MGDRKFHKPLAFKPHLAQENIYSLTPTRPRADDFGFESDEEQPSAPAASRYGPVDDEGGDSNGFKGDTDLVKQLKGRVTDLEDERGRLLAQLQNSEIELRKSNEKVANASKLSKNQVAMLKQHHDQQIADREAEIGALKQRDADNNQIIAALRHRLRDVLGSEARQEDLLRGEDKVVPAEVAEELRATVSDLRAKVASLESQIKVLRALPETDATAASNALGISRTLITPRGSMKGSNKGDMSSDDFAMGHQAGAGAAGPAGAQAELEELRRRNAELEEEKATLAAANGAGGNTALQESLEKYKKLKAQFRDLAANRDELEAAAKKKITEYKAKLKDAVAERDAALASASTAPPAAAAAPIVAVTAPPADNTASAAALTEAQGRAAALEQRVAAMEEEKAQWRREQEAWKRETDGWARERAGFEERVRSAEGASTAGAESLRRDYEERLKKATQSSAASARSLQALQRTSKEAASSVAALRKEVRSEMAAMAPTFADAARRIAAQLKEQQADAAGLRELYAREVALRRELYNEIQELKGNIRVYCRVRPLSAAEERMGDITCAFPLEGQVAIKDVKGPPASVLKTYEYNKVFAPDTTQETVFEDTRPLVTSVIDGYNVCIFAYGQTGAGKTYTMSGEAENPGVNVRALEELFRIIESRASEYSCEVFVSLLELYCDELRDLLVNPSSPEADKKLEIKQSKAGMYVPDLTEVKANSPDDCNKVMQVGNKNRSVGGTKLNIASSRSHMIVQVRAVSKNKESGESIQGKLTLVDLAGCERVAKSGVEGQALKEAQAINLSLSCLGDVIAALAQKASFVPYRNSQLTYLLQDSLGGNSKTLMFLNINPCAEAYDESVCALNFAQRVSTVELGKATKAGEAATPARRGRARGK